MWETEAHRQSVSTRESRVPDTFESLQLKVKKLEHELFEATKREGFTWIYGFVDIIYVATVYAIEQLFAQCGDNPRVFLMAAAYFGIMFSTRNHFDVYAFTFSVKKEHEVVRMIVFIIYCLGVYNMTLNIAFLYVGENFVEDSNSIYYGTCERDITYDRGFGIAFLLTRAAIMALYLYIYFNQDAGVEELPRKEFQQLILKKFIPITLTIIVMFVIFAGHSPVIIFPLIALIEFFGDRISDVFVKLPKVLLPAPAEYQERLGAMFMLVLGETMVGLLFVHYNEDRPVRTYATVIAGFFIVAATGMQFFERAQSDIKEESATALHPLLEPPLYGSYVWFHGFIGFFMLIATNGVTEVYYSVAGMDHYDFDQQRLSEEYLKISGGLICVMICMLLMELMQPVNRANLFAYLPSYWNSDVTVEIQKLQYTLTRDHVYSKFLFLVKVFVVILHILLYTLGHEKAPGNYFVGITSLIVVIPTMCDFIKELWAFHVRRVNAINKTRLRNEGSHNLANIDARVVNHSHKDAALLAQIQAEQQHNQHTHQQPAQSHAQHGAGHSSHALNPLQQASSDVGAKSGRPLSGPNKDTTTLRENDDDGGNSTRVSTTTTTINTRQQSLQQQSIIKPISISTTANAGGRATLTVVGKDGSRPSDTSGSDGRGSSSVFESIEI